MRRMGGLVFQTTVILHFAFKSCDCVQLSTLVETSTLIVKHWWSLLSTPHPFTLPGLCLVLLFFNVYKIVFIVKYRIPERNS